MKYLASSVLLAAAALGAPTPLTKRSEVAEKAPIAEAFSKEFRTFVGRSEQDVEKFVSKGEKITEETKLEAAKWKQHAADAGIDATHAIAAAKRSLYIRRALADDAEFWVKETEEADSSAKQAAKLRRNSEDANDAAEKASEHLARTLKRLTSHDTSVSKEDVANAQRAADRANDKAKRLEREADEALNEATDSYALVAYTLQMRESPEKVEEFVKKDEAAAESAMAKERQAKREAFFSAKAARQREAVHDQTLRLRDNFTR